MVHFGVQYYCLYVGVQYYCLSAIILRKLIFDLYNIKKVLHISELPCCQGYPLYIRCYSCWYPYSTLIQVSNKAELPQINNIGTEKGLQRFHVIKATEIPLQ